MTSLSNLHKRSSKKKRNSRISFVKESNTTKNKRITNSAFVVYALTFFAFIIVFQAFRWQILYAEKFEDLSQKQYLSTQISIAPRGKITGSDNTILAVDQPVWNIYATLSNDPEEREIFFKGKDKFVAEVSAILGIEEEEVSSKLKDDFVYAPIKKEVTIEKKKALESANIFGKGTEGFGLYFEREEKRVYPNGTLAAHILGFFGKDAEGKTVGQYGIQGYYFGDISGREGYSNEEKDSSGNIILTSEYNPVLAREGKDFKLTIVPNIQSKVESILEEGVKRTRSKSGSVIIMDPATGAIITMANYPTYDPSEYWRAPESWILKNRAISDVYEHGSVEKPITIAIALENKVIDKNYICNDSSGFLDLYKVTGYNDLKGQRIYTWNKKAAGNLDIAEIFKTSNNPCAALTALKVDSQKYYSALREFGIGEFIGIGLQDESTNYLRSFDEWTKLDIITSSYGQGISATPLQVISALSAFANNGVRMKPYIIEEITDAKDSIKIKPQVLATPISVETANIVKEALKVAVERGSLGGLAKELGNYEIAAKTGTAQISKTGITGYQKTYTNDTVVGFAPVESPKMIMLVKLEEPQVADFSSLTTVPLWKDIFLAIADDLEIKKRN